MNSNIIKSIKERINNEGRIQDIVELSLDDLEITTITPEIGHLFRNARNLEILILTDNDLENVDNLPKLDLTVLDLSNNRFSSILFRINEQALIRISEFQDLGQLTLTANQIRTLEGLRPLFKLQKLIELDLSENPVADLPGYR